MAWAGEVLDVRYDPAQSTWITRLNDDGSPKAVVVYTTFTKHNCEMSIATNGDGRWASREFLRVLYDYPFNKLKVARITVVVRANNERSITVCRKIGHIEEGRLKCWFGAEDGIVMRMARDECRWIRGNT